MINKSKIRIAIIGSKGYVGSSQKKLWGYNSQYEIIEYDEPLNLGTKEKVNATQLSVVCVPTLSLKDGECDVSIVEEVVGWIETPVILIKSTVPPGTTDSLKAKYKKRVVFSPEFIGENKYWSPFKFHNNALETPFFILGGEERDASYVYDLLLPILGPNKIYSFTDAKTAEMTKYMCNSYGAMKVTWANEMKNICEVLGIDYGKARELWALDPRVEKAHTIVFKNKPGFGGKCYPKDVLALIKFSEKAGYSPDLIKEIIRSNKKFRKNL